MVTSASSAAAMAPARAILDAAPEEQPAQRENLR
jgi:hypothetical protein